MKTAFLIALGVVFLVTGCAQVPQEAAQRLAQAQLRFNEVKHGMSKDELLAALGPPKEEKAGRCYWESTYSRWNHESLSVEFDEAGKVSTIRIVHREAYRPRAEEKKSPTSR